MRRHLAARGIDSEEIDDAVEALKDQGYVDDVRYVRVFAEDKRTLEQWGSGRIASALRERGISQTLIEALCEEEPVEAERGRALALLATRFPDPPVQGATATGRWESCCARATISSWRSTH